MIALLAFALVLPLAAYAAPAVVEGARLALAPARVGAPDPLEWPAGVVSGGAEPTIVADKFGKYLWIGDTSGIRRSANNGSSWTFLRPFDHASVFGDGWTIAQDDAGTLYVATTRGPNLIFSASRDGGTTWFNANPALDVAPIADRPWLAARGQGEVILLQNAWPIAETCARSVDGGATWIERDPLGVGNPIAGAIAYDNAGYVYWAEETGTIIRGRTCLGQWLKTTPFHSTIRPGYQLAVSTDGTSAYVAASRAVAGSPASFGPPVVGGVNWTNLLNPARKQLVLDHPEVVTSVFATVSAIEDEVAVAYYGSSTPGDPQHRNYEGNWHVYVARIKNFWSATPTITIARVVTNMHNGEICMAGTTCTSTDRDLLDYFGIDHDVYGKLHVAYGYDWGISGSQVRHLVLPDL